EATRAPLSAHVPQAQAFQTPEASCLRVCYNAINPRGLGTESPILPTSNVIEPVFLSRSVRNH
ncbi:MAG: hypothetical protein K9N52_05505, partial [Verrucomicrobia bacterium]|nr:hypothetical protein [Verrucomicrobiota bacterium]